MNGLSTITSAAADISARDAPPPRYLRIPLPRLNAVPGCTATVGAATLAGALVRGTLPTGSPAVWPLVVLTVAALGYDLGLRALRARRSPAAEPLAQAVAVLVSPPPPGT